MRLLPRVFIPVCLFMLLIGYQNFSTPTQREWDSQTPLKVIAEMQDFQRKDPGLPQTLATPSGGSDFESVRNNWAEKQSKILLNGFDKRVENAVNDKINSFIASFTQRDPAEESKKQEAGSADLASIDPGTPAAESKSEPAAKPKVVLKFPRPNMIKYEMGDDASLNVIANPGETLLNYSRAYNAQTRVGIEHATSKNQTQMFLRYDW